MGVGGTLALALLYDYVYILVRKRINIFMNMESTLEAQMEAHIACTYATILTILCKFVSMYNDMLSRVSTCYNSQIDEIGLTSKWHQRPQDRAYERRRALPNQSPRRPLSLVRNGSFDEGRKLKQQRFMKTFGILCIFSWLVHLVRQLLSKCLMHNEPNVFFSRRDGPIRTC